MSMIIEKADPLCNHCPSRDVTCRGEYYTGGGDMEHVEFIHECRGCGYKESTIVQSTYGYDWEYECSLPHAHIEVANEQLYEAQEGTPVELVDVRKEVFGYFIRHPNRMFDLSPRKFDELVADILREFGFDVELTPATRDGGKDIYAYLRNTISSFVLFVECKRWRPTRWESM